MEPLEANPLETKTQNCYLESAAVTSTGYTKEANEDAILDLCEYGIFCVADGTGGPVGGKRASEEIVDAIQQKFWDTKFEDVKTILSTVKEALGRSKIRIKRIAGELGIDEMGAAVAILHLNPIKNSAFIIHAGDCRVYRFRNNSLTRLTQDHSVAAEMGLSESDDISHIVQEKLTKAVGLYERINPETTSIEFLPGDYYLITSSGLSQYLQNSDIVDSINKYGQVDVYQAANDLINKTKEMGAAEDVSILLVKVVEEAQPEEIIAKKKFNFVPILAGLIFIVLLGIVAKISIFNNNKKEGIPNSSEIVNNSSENPLPPSKEERASTAEDPQGNADIGNEDSKNSEIEKPTPMEAKLHVQSSDVSTNENPQANPEIGNEDSKNLDIAKSSPQETKPHVQPNDISTNETDREKIGNEDSKNLDIAKSSPQETKLNVQPNDNTSTNETNREKIESMKSTDSEKKVAVDQKPKSIEIDLAMSDKKSKRTLYPNQANSLKNRISNGEKDLLPPISIKNPPLGESRVKVNLYNNGVIEVLQKSSVEPSPRIESVAEEPIKPDEEKSVPSKENEKIPKQSSDPDGVDLIIPKPQDKRLPQSISESKKAQAQTASEDNAVESQEISKSEQVLNDFNAQLSSFGLLAAITEVNWSFLKPEDKKKVQNKIMKTFLQWCLNFRNGNYSDGDRVWEILKVAPGIDDPTLSQHISELKINVQKDFKREVLERIKVAQKNCQWSPVHSILQDNSEASDALISTSLIQYINIWSDLGLGDSHELDIKNYFERSRNIYNKLQPLVDVQRKLENNRILVSKIDELSALEICQKLSEFRADIKIGLLDAIERLSLNFSIINPVEIEPLMYSVYPNDQSSNWQSIKLKMVIDGLDKLLKLRNRLHSQEDVQLPMEELAMFEINAQELSAILEEVQDHLLFVSILLKELNKQMEHGEKPKISDDQLVMDFISQFELIDSIFSTETAHYFNERFSRSLISENY